MFCTLSLQYMTYCLFTDFWAFVSAESLASSGELKKYVYVMNLCEIHQGGGLEEGLDFQVYFNR